MGCLLVANGLHTYGVFVQRSSIISSTRVIPYYFPLEATRTLEKWGLKHSPNVLNANVGKGNVNFPLHPLKVANAKRPNIIFILIDSWNMHTLTKETMPVAWQFAMDNQWYHNHFSSSNGTRYSTHPRQCHAEESALLPHCLPARAPSANGYSGSNHLRP